MPKEIQLSGKRTNKGLPTELRNVVELRMHMDIIIIHEYGLVFLFSIFSPFPIYLLISLLFYSPLSI